MKNKREWLILTSLIVAVVMVFAVIAAPVEAFANAREDYEAAQAELNKIEAQLSSMKDHIIEALTEGQVVVLDDLGRFQVTIQGKCYTADDIADKEFAPSSKIKGHKIVFRPDAALKKAVAADFSLKRISSEAMA